MSRKMTDSFGRLFEHLEDFCARRGDAVQTPRRARWVTADSDAARELFKQLSVKELADFGHQRKLVWTSAGDDHYLCAIGFEHEPDLPQLQPLGAHSGFTMALLADCLPQPIASPAQVRNVVEVGAKGDEGYDGHDARTVEDLFPKISVWGYEGELDDEAAWRLFLMMCARECQLGGSWIDDTLAGRLTTLTDLAIPHLPYAAICQSMFDADPRTMYLALYRCIEATYAYNSAQKLIRRLALPVGWVEVAQAMNEEIGWHPQEAASLNLILDNALDRDLQAVCDAMKASVGSDLKSSAGKAIYLLRNRIVHYRPGADAVAIDEYDWNLICCVIVDITFHVFTHAFPPYVAAGNVAGT